jgi:hypothetical protein
MLVYAEATTISTRCPSCDAAPGVWCGYDRNGPKVHERRLRLSEDVDRALTRTARKSNPDYLTQIALDTRKKGTTVDRDRKISLLDQQIETLAERRAMLASRPEDDFEDGAIVAFDKQFNNEDGPKYAYIAVKGGAKWWVSGRYHESLSWDGLMDLAESDGGTVDGLWYVTAMEPLS